MAKILIIVDMQNDFITESLANKDADKIVPDICNHLKNNKYDGIILTRDTHGFNYLNTPEGKNLPIRHCVRNTAGWCIDDRILNTLEENNISYSYKDKMTFGVVDWPSQWDKDDIELTLVGTCTDICVVSNALILKALCPNAIIKVIGNLCAGTTSENHEAALEVMKSCQIEVI